MSSSSPDQEGKPSQFIFDTSAVLAIIFNEPGAESAIPHLSSGVFSTVNLAEAATVGVRKGIEFIAVREMLSRLPLEIVPLDDNHAYRTASLQPFAQSHNLSLGDRACLGVALSLGLPVLTADRRWAELTLGIEVRLIR